MCECQGNLLERVTLILGLPSLLVNHLEQYVVTYSSLITRKSNDLFCEILMNSFACQQLLFEWSDHKLRVSSTAKGQQQHRVHHKYYKQYHMEVQEQEFSQLKLTFCAFLFLNRLSTQCEGKPKNSIRCRKDTYPRVTQVTASTSENTSIC